MNFTQAIQSGFKKYFSCKGRASRSEYWYWILFTNLASFGTQMLEKILFGASFYGDTAKGHPISMILGLAIILPTLTLGVRRLQDIDKSGWWLLISVIPIIGPLILVVFACRKGTTGTNRFGPDPLVPIAV